MTATEWTINDIQREMRARGSHWWDPSTMRWFGTRVCGAVFNGPNGVFFVTSEKPPHGPRAYTIRKFDPTETDIDTVGELCGYKTRATALRHAEKMAGTNPIAIEEPLRAVTEAEQFLADVRKHGNPHASGAITGRLMREARRHHRMMELLCSDEAFCRQLNEDGEHPQVVKLEAIIENLAEGVGAKAHFQGDPRGVTVKLIFPNGATNDWGKEGWCVPTE